MAPDDEDDDQVWIKERCATFKKIKKKEEADMKHWAADSDFLPLFPSSPDLGVNNGEGREELRILFIPHLCTMTAVYVKGCVC